MSFFESLAGGAIGAIGSIFNNERNLSFQKDAQNYTKWLNNVTWQREDNAVQRRVADLKAAGLSPVLAAGSSAQAGSPVKIDPQNVSENVGESFISGATKAAQTQQSLMAAEAARQQINLSKNQAELINEQKEKVKTETSILKYDDFLYRLFSKYPRLQTSGVQDLIKYLESPEGKKKIQKMQETYDNQALKVKSGYISGVGGVVPDEYRGREKEYFKKIGVKK